MALKCQGCSTVATGGHTGKPDAALVDRAIKPYLCLTQAGLVETD